MSRPFPPIARGRATAALLAALVPAAFAIGPIAVAHAQNTATSTTPAPAAKAAPESAPGSLVVYFDLGSASVRTQDQGVLDQASHLYREGNPIVMIVSGSTDSTGSALANLRLSQERADTVVRALVARGIPADRFQVLAKGETDLAVPTGPDTAQDRNRRVEITWR